MCVYTTHTYIYTQIFFKIDFIYLFVRDTEGQRPRQREKQAPCGEPNVEFNSRTPGSRPEPQGDAQALSHPGARTDMSKHRSLLLAMNVIVSPYSR